MAFTVAQLTAIEESIGAGELEVTFDGKTTKYASFDDLRQRYDFVRSQLIASGLISDTRTRVTVASFSKE